ncbi:MAG: HIT family protein [Bacteroidetes bacterium]|nr:HIT family protein [Bacteroidota bacterium]
MNYKSPTCPFCKDDIKDIAFLESENFYVIYNYAPILPGHSLVIPKNHIQSLLELDENQHLEFFQLSLKAAKLILKVFNADSFNWTVQEKPPAGQSIPHLHLHIFPRHEHDLPNPGDWYPLLKENEKAQYIDSDSDKRVKLSRQEQIDIVNHIKTFL